MLRSSRLLLAATVMAVCFGVGAIAHGGDNLVVHEWGTFTSLQNEDGQSLPGINIDDEPVPKFVHNLNPHVLADSYSLRHVQMKGAPQRHPYVTMRLETPIIYFYPPKGADKPLTIDVDVAMRGGWLTEFYPKAKADAPGLKSGNFEFGKITPATLGTLSWRNLQIGGEGRGPETDEHVWTAPRQVDAANVTNSEGESERYLFYRGVANLDAPLRLSQISSSQSYAIRGNFGAVLSPSETVDIGPLWLVDIRHDGGCAFRQIERITAGADEDAVLGHVPSGFRDEEYSSENLADLKRTMHSALTADGLYGDEATGLLSTWQRAYFKSPGLRLFFLVPRAWTDHYLPLSLSKKADVVRTMVARVELISPIQQAILHRLSETAVSNPRWVSEVLDSSDMRQFAEGRGDLGHLRGKVPADYQMYLELGRFRNALVVAEEKRRPNSSLTKFIDTYGLEPFRVAGNSNESRSTAQRARLTNRPTQ